MDKIPIPEQDVVPIETIAPNVVGLRVLIVNVYAISRSPDEWVLVDCGLPYSTGRIKHWVGEQFGAGARPMSILLTHGHFDHTGSVEELAREWDVPVYVHPLEVPYVSGKSEYPPPDLPEMPLSPPSRNPSSPWRRSAPNCTGPRRITPRIGMPPAIPSSAWRLCVPPWWPPVMGGRWPAPMLPMRYPPWRQTFDRVARPSHGPYVDEPAA